MIDLAPADLATVQRLLAQHVPTAEVRAFGSRVCGGAKPYSDLDLAVVGKARLSIAELGALREAFEESSLPMRVDVVDWCALTPEFRREIERGFTVVHGGVRT